MQPADDPVCGHCGAPASVGEHAACAERLALEPPRYCTTCGRRMKVQVTPDGWTAECVRHGSVGASTWG